MQFMVKKQINKNKSHLFLSELNATPVEKITTMAEQNNLAARQTNQQS